MTDDRYRSPLGSRYASPAMQTLFGEPHRIALWRRLWLALAEAERELGVPIPDAALDCRVWTVLLGPFELRCPVARQIPVADARADSHRLGAAVVERDGLRRIAAGTGLQLHPKGRDFDRDLPRCRETADQQRRDREEWVTASRVQGLVRVNTIVWV
jgi:hypothetical protein